MSSRPAPSTTPSAGRVHSPSRTSSRGLPAARTAVPDPALDEALERISDLAARLWAVRSAHRPVTTGWRRTHTRCAECGQPVPCATLQAAG